MADICGPWTLEGLDNFGSIDSLAFSLDDPIWESADTCVLDGAGTIVGQGNVFANAVYTAAAEAIIVASGDLTSGVIRQRDFSAVITGTGEIVVVAVGKERMVDDLIFVGEGNLSVLAGYTASVSVAISGVGSLSSTANYTAGTGGAFSGSVTLDANAYYYGQEWTVVPFESNVWTEVSSS